MLAESIRVASKQASVFVNDLSQCPLHERFSAVLSTKELKIYAVRQDTCAHLCNLVGHGGGITHQSFISENNPHLLLSTSTDGALFSWDIRNASFTERSSCGFPSHSLRPHYYCRFRHRQGVECVTHREHLTAVGTDDGLIIFLDDRKNEVVAKYEETHVSTVTWVAFHPDDPNIFCSSSDDGMLAVFDLSEGLDEDSSFKAGQNLNAIARFGFYGRENSILWCQTAQHGIVLWEWKEAMQEDSENGACPLYSLTDIRPRLTPVNYKEVSHCITCFHNTSELIIVGGNDTGDTGLYSLTVFEGSGSRENFGPCRELKNGHCSPIHCFLPWNDVTCLTGGEDAKICLWDLSRLSKPAVNPESHSRLKSRPRNQKRMCPY